MYIVVVRVKFEDNTIKEKIFDFWCDAGAWIEYLAECESVLKTVQMSMIRK